MKIRVSRSACALLLLIVAALLVPAAPSSGGKGGVPQASLNLKNCDAQFCYTHENEWELTKEATGNTVADGSGTVTWTVTATKSSGPTSFTIHGGLTITNSGSGAATIGNIVVNLQKPAAKNKQNIPWVSIAADMANAASGDAATTAHIVATGSAENATVNAAQGAANYTVSGAKGTFKKTAGSGSLEFTDATSNTVFSLKPPKTIGPGESVTLLYDASFSVAVLPPAGTKLRTEALVTFGNAGERGGSGAVGTSIDISGNGSVGADEANVRTVPCRVTMAALPAAPEECNDSVVAYDSYPESITTTGTVTTANPVGFDQFPAFISDSQSWEVSVDVEAGAEGGQLCNTAELDGTDSGGTLNVIVGYEEDEFGQPILNELGQPIPIFATFICCEGIDLQADSCVEIGATASFQEGDYCTFTRHEYGDPSGGPNQTPAQILYQTYYNSTIFPAGLTIGVNDAGGPNHHAFWDTATGGSGGIMRLRTYLHNAVGGGNPNGSLTADTTNANSTSGGELAKQSATLTLNVVFNDAGVAGGVVTSPKFGDLELCDLVAGSQISDWTLTATQAAALNGTSVRQVLSAANSALGTGALPGYASDFDELASLVEALNFSFDDCVPSAFATAHLCEPAP